MCLSRVWIKTAGGWDVIPTRLQAWKVMRVLPSGKVAFPYRRLSGLYHLHDGDTAMEDQVVEVGVWHERQIAGAEDLYAGNQTYPAGFHCLVSRQDAEAYVGEVEADTLASRNQLAIVVVMVDGVLAVGQQGGLPIIVAKRLMIENEWEIERLSEQDAEASV